VAKETTPAASVERLARELYQRDPDDAFARELAAWLAGSSRFRAFAEAHRDKIRKKLRTAGDAEALLDIRAELGAAHLLLADRRIELAYEAYGSGNAGPDFTLTFRDTRACNIEVTRSRRAPDAEALGWVILAKLRQLPPSLPNLLLVAVAGEHADALDVAGAVRVVRSRAEAKDEAFFARRGFDGTRGFFDRFLRLGGVITWCESESGDDRAALWVNGSARIAVPDRAARATLACLRHDG
jgi:hypothetical protein